MDLSKLPKLSDTKSQETPETAGSAPTQSDPRPRAVYAAAPRQPGIGVDIWISLVVGLLLLALGRNFGDWAMAKMRHQPFHTEFFWPDEPPYNGREEEYFELLGYTALSDMGIFLFGAMLLAEAAAKALLVFKPGKVSRAFLMLAILLTAGTTLLNLYACFKIFSFGNTPMVSGLAVAFGGWILFDEWTALQRAAPMRFDPSAIE